MRSALFGLLAALSIGVLLATGPAKADPTYTCEGPTAESHVSMSREITTGQVYPCNSPFGWNDLDLTALNRDLDCDQLQSYLLDHQKGVDFVGVCNDGAETSFLLYIGPAFKKLTVNGTPVDTTNRIKVPVRCDSTKERCEAVIQFTNLSNTRRTMRVSREPGRAAFNDYTIEDFK